MDSNKLISNYKHISEMNVSKAVARVNSVLGKVGSVRGRCVGSVSEN